MEQNVVKAISMADVDIEGDFISASVHKPLGVTELIVLEEFKKVPTDFGEKFAGKVQTNEIKPQQKVFQMNNTSAKIVAKVLGKNTLSWIGKKLAINYVLQNVSGEMKDIIYVDEMRTMTLNHTQTTIPNSGIPPTV